MNKRLTNSGTLHAVRSASLAWQIASERDGWRAGEFYHARLMQAKRDRKAYLQAKRDRTTVTA